MGKLSAGGWEDCPRPHSCSMAPRPVQPPTGVTGQLLCPTETFVNLFDPQRVNQFLQEKWWVTGFSSPEPEKELWHELETEIVPVAWVSCILKQRAILLTGSLLRFRNPENNCLPSFLQKPEFDYVQERWEVWFWRMNQRCQHKSLRVYRLLVIYIALNWFSLSSLVKISVLFQFYK